MTTGPIDPEPAVGQPGRMGAEPSRQDQAPAADSSTGPLPAISLPKGGGAIRGIGEKFSANPVTGAGSMTVPIYTSPGRSGFGPQLTLSYDSCNGNGFCGFGWSLSLPSITRKTDKGLPRYIDDGVDADVHILSGAEDLVPVYRQDQDGSWVASHPDHHRDPEGSWVRDRSGELIIHDDELDGYRVRRYRPRVEGLFARIERWSKVGSPSDIHWRSISKDNILTIYGLDGQSRVTDPQDPARIFSWLICETRDDKGNAVLYRYKEEDGLGVDPGQAHERNRGPQNDARRTANRYLKRIYYGNRTPLLNSNGQRPRFLDRKSVATQIANFNWMFEVVFDYGDHHPTAPTPRDDTATVSTGTPKHPWARRPDPFSSYRPGFEVRTTRLCQRVLMFHHFPGTEHDGVGTDCLVRSTDLTYTDEPDPTSARNPVYTFLSSVTQTGYKRSPDGYVRRSLPSVEFEYTQPVVQDTVEEVDPESVENLPVGLDGSAYRWIDLHGDGIPGILTEQAGAWFYKHNISPLPIITSDGRERVAARFGPMASVALKPNAALGGGAEFMDLAGDGQPDVVILGGPTPGLYEHDDDEGWQPFRTFASQPTLDMSNPNVRLIDLNGDGQPDVMITEQDAIAWHPSLGEDGFGPASRVPHAFDEEAGPRVVFADGTQSIYLADLSGDGLPDIARIRNGDVCYWPNLGYGRFGGKISMDNAPWFDHPDQFDQRRIHVGDLDGSGTTDIAYVHRDGVRLYFNQSGNSWSKPEQVAAFPRVDDLANITVVDLLGTGTACFVWSSPLPGDTRRPMRYVNLMGARKPHLLVKTMNNLGAETRIDYAPSTKFSLQDKRDGHPWITRLPFPVHVVERVETYDYISRNRFVTRYSYHHGRFHGKEREFCGFGLVQQWDTEQFAALTATGTMPSGENIDAASHVPPVLTKTWFHTGTYPGYEGVSRQYEHEYFREPGLTAESARDLLLNDTVLPAGLTVDEALEACRALKRSMLRQEVYAQDAGPGATPSEIERARTPYTVTEQNFNVRMVQPRGGNRHAVFLTHPLEAITYHYERNPADPRVQHALTLEVDAYGNVLKQVAIGYGRRTTQRIVDPNGTVRVVPNPGLRELHTADQIKQTTPLLTYTENRVTNPIDTTDAYRCPLGCETRTFELTKYTPSGPELEARLERKQVSRRFRSVDLVETDPGSPDRLQHIFSAEVPYEAAALSSDSRRLIECARTLFRRDDLSGLIPLGRLQTLALTGEVYRLALTPGLLDEVLIRPRKGGGLESLLPNPAEVLGGQRGDQGGYVSSQMLRADGRFPAEDPDDYWWIPSGRSFYTSNPNDSPSVELAQARQHFYTTRRHRDPFGYDSVIDLDDNDLLVVETRDALRNRITVDVNDYRVLKPRKMSDPNRNRTEIAFDTVGMVAGTAVMGKPPPAPVEGDTLQGFLADLTQTELDGFIDASDPHSKATALLGGATTRIMYDLHRFHHTRQANPNDPTAWEPVCAAVLARETHTADTPPPHGMRIQLHFAYSDGFGRVIQQKTKAEPGPVIDGGPVLNPRWVGSGWRIYNNKRQTVRQYERFFSQRVDRNGDTISDHRFEFGAKYGVSPVLFYDPTGRIIATLHPNHTYEKVVFDPWQQTSFDVNDNCAPRNAQTGDPRTDPDISGHVAGYFQNALASQAPSWRTWRSQRISGVLGPHEQAAAEGAAAHADTPTTIRSDPLGRPFLTVTRNHVVSTDHPLDEDQDNVVTRVDLDIEGNQLQVRDERRLPVDYLPTRAREQRTIMRYAYDMLGNRIHQLSMEAGGRWTLNDVYAQPIRAWDSRGHNHTTTYDPLRRPLRRTVRGTIAESDPRTVVPTDIVVESIEYGEPAPGASQRAHDRATRLNLRARIFQHFHSAGVTTNAQLDTSGIPLRAYDFKGNLLRSTHRLTTQYKAIPNWAHNPPLETEYFEAATRYDALNRPIQLIAPHSSISRAKCNITQPEYNEANLLRRVDVWLERASEPAKLLNPNSETPASVGVADINYNAKGQRIHIIFKNGASTRYHYDPDTFRLTQLYTRRDIYHTEDCGNPHPPPSTIAAPATPPWGDSCGLQNLNYTYDPAGNITHIQDDAQQTIYFKNKRVEPNNDYIYDALYRLVQATGREHLGQGGATITHSHNDAGRVGISSADAGGRFAPYDGNAMGRYVERYVYDAVGNLLQIQHVGSDAASRGWTRRYTYNETSLIEASKRNNRLSSTVIGGGGARTAETYLHDTHGNIVRMPHLGGGLAAPNMHWDYKGQLRQTELGGGGTVYYIYDTSGQRVRKVWEKAPNLSDERIYIGGLEIFRSHKGAIGANSATLERETLHVIDNEQRLALIETRTHSRAGNDPLPPQLIRYQFGNHLESASLELDDRAQIISYEEYTPYGSTSFQAGRSAAEVGLKRYRYTARERDKETGLSYHRARYYAPWISRWIACDPFGIEGGMCLYAYAAGNPVGARDDRGLQANKFTNRTPQGEILPGGVEVLQEPPRPPPGVNGTQLNFTTQTPQGEVLPGGTVEVAPEPSPEANGTPLDPDRAAGTLLRLAALQSDFDAYFRQPLTQQLAQERAFAAQFAQEQAIPEWPQLRAAELPDPLSGIPNHKVLTDTLAVPTAMILAEGVGGAVAAESLAASLEGLMIGTAIRERDYITLGLVGASHAAGFLLTRGRSQGALNQISGDEWERDLISKYTYGDWTARKVPGVLTPISGFNVTGIRKPDIGIYYKGELVEFLEAKASATAGYGTFQRLADEWIYKTFHVMTSVIRRGPDGNIL